MCQSHLLCENAGLSCEHVSIVVNIISALKLSTGVLQNPENTVGLMTMACLPSECPRVRVTPAVNQVFAPSFYNAPVVRMCCLYILRLYCDTLSAKTTSFCCWHSASCGVSHSRERMFPFQEIGPILLTLHEVNKSPRFLPHTSQS